MLLCADIGHFWKKARKKFNSSKKKTRKTEAMKLNHGNLTKIIELCWNNQFLSLFMPNRGLIFRWWTTALCWPTSAPRSTPRPRLTIPTTRNPPTGTKGRRSKTRRQPSLKTGTRTRPNSFLTHQPPSQTVKPLFSLLRFFLTSAFIIFGPRRTPTYDSL